MLKLPVLRLLQHLNVTQDLGLLLQRVILELFVEHCVGFQDRVEVVDGNDLNVAALQRGAAQAVVRLFVTIQLRDADHVILADFRDVHVLLSGNLAIQILLAVTTLFESGCNFSHFRTSILAHQQFAYREHSLVRCLSFIELNFDLLVFLGTVSMIRPVLKSLPNSFRR